MNCPDCDREMHSDKCACGWTMPAAGAPAPVNLATAVCAAVDERALNDARRFCAERGLDTREKQWKFIKSKMAASPMFAGIPAPREPGEDSQADVYGDAA